LRHRERCQEKDRLDSPLTPLAAQTPSFGYFSERHSYKYRELITIVKEKIVAKID
jgi:hypothetical protein